MLTRSVYYFYLHFFKKSYVAQTALSSFYQAFRRYLSFAPQLQFYTLDLSKSLQRLSKTPLLDRNGLSISPQLFTCLLKKHVFCAIIEL